MCRKASLGVIVTKRQRIELGHTLGFIREHQRPDRDQYVTINWALIEPGEEYNFDILPDSQLYTDYDFMSIMHYHGREFLRDDLRDDDHYSTIEPKDPYQGYLNIMGKSEFPSEGDKNSLSWFYAGECPMSMAIKPTILSPCGETVIYGLTPFIYDQYGKCLGGDNTIIVDLIAPLSDSWIEFNGVNYDGRHLEFPAERAMCDQPYLRIVYDGVGRRSVSVRLHIDNYDCTEYWNGFFDSECPVPASPIQELEAGANEPEAANTVCYSPDGTMLAFPSKSALMR